MTALCIICGERPQTRNTNYCAHCLQHAADLIAAVDADPDLKQELIEMAQAEHPDDTRIVDPSPEDLAARGATDNQDFIESVPGEYSQTEHGYENQAGQAGQPEPRTYCQRRQRLGRDSWR
ncbi:MAG: hypothetical protein JW910_17710 [Anaerolineae bacterium]|nr:hypothetical protein [Anaerolineae bacterium]